jgi:ABC-2 type transport system ATP-binding protein
MTLPADQAAAATAKLKMLPSVATLEQTGPENSTVQITAFPKSGALLIEDVSALAVRENWKLKELYAEAGRLDEVFRAITTHDTARTRASAA